MATETHERAIEWTVNATGATLVDERGPFHLRDSNGQRIRVAGRHVEGRQPNYFALGPTLDGDPFDSVVVVLFNPDWSVLYAYDVSVEAARRHHKQPGRQACRLMIRGDDSWRRDPAVIQLAP